MSARPPPITVVRPSSPATHANAGQKTGPVRNQGIVPAQRHRARHTIFVDCLMDPSNHQLTKALADSPKWVSTRAFCVERTTGFEPRDPHLGKVMFLLRRVGWSPLSR